MRTCEGNNRNLLAGSSITVKFKSKSSPDTWERLVRDMSKMSVQAFAEQTCFKNRARALIAEADGKEGG